MLDKIALWAVIIGALNWFLVGLFQLDVVSYFLGDGSVGSDVIYSRIVYVLVGLAGLYLLPRALGTKLARKN
jgi:uncharacterized protein